MAVGEYIGARICTVDGCGRAGKITKGFCTRHYFQYRAHGAVGPRAQTCQQCQQQFIAQRARMYCGARCNSIAQDRKAGRAPKAIYEAERRNPRHYFKCEWCAKDAYRVLGGASQVKGYGNRWCSQACKVAQNADARGKRAADGTQARALQTARSRLVSLLRSALKQREWRASCLSSCKQCGVQFTGMRAGLAYCSESCAKAAYRGSQAFKAHKRARRKADKYRRRASVIERFDPLEVLARDRWRCQLCGVKTPERLRGTYQPNAPELDHIIPIALGGSHSRANTQCACRSCNGTKGARELGQLLLVV